MQRRLASTGLRSHGSKAPRARGLFFDDGGVGGVFGDGGDAVLHRDLGAVHLAGADDLAVGGFEVEVGLAVLCDLDLESVGVDGVLLDGLYTIEAGGLGVVTLAGEDNLAVGGLRLNWNSPFFLTEMTNLPIVLLKFRN